MERIIEFIKGLILSLKSFYLTYWGFMTLFVLTLIATLAVVIKVEVIL